MPFGCNSNTSIWHKNAAMDLCRTLKALRRKAFLTRCSDCITRSQKRTSALQMSFFVGSAAKGGWNPSGFQCSGRRSHPCAKVLAYGQNACAAHSRRGPEGPFSSSSAAVPPIQNIDFNRPFHKRNLLLIEFKSRFLSILRQFFFQKQ